MTLRIWHQSFTVLGDLPAYVDALKARIAEVVTPGTEVVLHGQIPNTYTSEYPGTDLGFNFLYRLHELQWAAAAREAERQGFDAMVLGSVPSPMIRELRTLVERKSDVIAEWVHSGRLRPVAPHHLVFGLWALTQHYADFASQLDALLGPDDSARFRDAEAFLTGLFDRGLARI